MTPPLRRLALAAAATLALAAPAAAAPVRAPIAFDGIYVFGDSLSDNGNAFAITRGRVPAFPPYVRGRFSNGAIWYDHVSRAFRAEGRETINYAVGGARARTNLDAIPDLGPQVATFLERAEPGPNPLGAFFIGGNDLLDRVGDGSMPRVARNAADRITAAAAALYRDGVGTAMLFNLPDLGGIARFAGASPERRQSATLGSTTFNARLADGAESLRALGMTVIEVDTFALFNDVRANPQVYGITNFSRPCVRDGRNTCTPRQAARTAFYDQIHPTRALHAILGREVLDLIAPVERAAPSLAAIAAGGGDGARSEAAVVATPLPGTALLLLAAVGGLAAARRRRRALPPPGGA